MNYESIEFGGEVYCTGNLQPKIKATFAPEFKPKMSKRDIEDAIREQSIDVERDLYPSEQYVKNQGQIGSCNAYAAKGALERTRHFVGLPYVELSAEHLYMRICGGRDQGSMLDEGMHEMTQSGIPPMKPSHYQKFKERDFTPEDNRDAVRFKSVECYAVNTELGLAEGLVSGFVGVIAVHATNAYMRMDANEIIARSMGVGNHAEGTHKVNIINGELAFRKFGSWGLNVWNGGCGYVTWKNHLEQPNKYHQFYLIRGASDDTQDSVPELKQ
jgi:hypothetical protein